VTGRRPAPPSGFLPPDAASLGDGPPVPLAPLAQEICRRYRCEFPDEQERYGEAGLAWCVHDNQHLLSWAAGAVRGLIDMHAEVAWLGKVLESRDFPLGRLARNLQIGAEVVLEQEELPRRQELSDVLAGAAEHVLSRDTFLA
jgi:hypothetical protein